MLSGLFTTDVLSFVKLERIRSPNWEPFRALLETSETYELFNKAHVTPETSSKVSESQPKGTQREGNGKGGGEGTHQRVPTIR